MIISFIFLRFKGIKVLVNEDFYLKNKITLYNYVMRVSTLLLILGIILGIFVANIPVGICAIVKSAKVKGWRKAVLLPLSIFALVLYFIAFVVIYFAVVFLVLIITGLAISIVTLSVSSHFVSKQTNKIYTEKTLEHKQSVAKNVEKLENQQSYINEIRALKELLDSNAISKEDYEKKKNEILNRK